MADFVGPMVAAALSVPWAGHGITIAMPAAFTRAMEATVAARYAERGLSPTARVAFVDPWPEALQPDGIPTTEEVQTRDERRRRQKRCAADKNYVRKG